VIDAEDLFLTEEFTVSPTYDVRDTAGGRLVLPAADRSPIQAGFDLTWREYPKRGPAYTRKGLVVSCAPLTRSVWVQPDEPLPGEGPAVVVRNVTSDECAGAERRVGVLADYMSTEGWQRPRTLPRAVVRTDRAADGRSVLRVLHADPGCPSPPARVFGSGVVRGRARSVDTCYVFRRHYLHPWSIRPAYGRRGQRKVVTACMVCLKTSLPKVK
jgi:hypothetical protein